MSSDSDTDEEDQIKKFLEAADHSLLNNDMFKRNETILERESSEPVCDDDKKILKTDFPKSQRYIIDESENSGIDFHLPDSMQRYLAKKFSEISEKYYEFYDAPKDNVPKVKSKHRNRVKLLNDNECFVNAYETFEYEIKGPIKKPVIKKRMVDKIDGNIAEDDLKSVAIDGNLVLSGQEVSAWAKKKERKDKVFYYKMASNGVLHAKDERNEFTELRNRNKWNENKIKNFKKP